MHLLFHADSFDACTGMSDKIAKRMHPSWVHVCKRPIPCFEVGWVEWSCLRHAVDLVCTGRVAVVHQTGRTDVQAFLVALPEHWESQLVSQHMERSVSVLCDHLQHVCTVSMDRL